MKTTHFLCATILTAFTGTTQAQSIVKLTDPQDITVNNGKMIIQNSGQVLIGVKAEDVSKTPASYNLVVTKGILTERLRVANAQDGANWSDFVFDNNYDLMPLTKVEAYIKKEKHLPGIPSANEVSKDGIDVATMDARLLQKIEELTLYVLQQQKQLDQQQEEITILKKQLKQQR